MTEPTMTLIHEAERAALSTMIATAVDEAITANSDKYQSWRLGPSALDDLCNRKIWYNFRWVKRDVREPRMRRLLDHGKEEEVRMVKWLRDAGLTVYEFNPEAKETAKNKQFGYRAIHGHMGGFLDGMCILPMGFPYQRTLVLEMKSSGKNDFNGLFKPIHEGGGVKKNKPGHYKQMCDYGMRYQIRYGLYVCLCKDDDRLHIEIVELDWNLAAEGERRLEEIILAKQPPTRIKETKTAFECKFCRHKEICHDGAAYEINCRSCVNATPVENGEWACALSDNAIIPRDFVKQGCSAFHPVGR